MFLTHPSDVGMKPEKVLLSDTQQKGEEEECMHAISLGGTAMVWTGKVLCFASEVS
jgi:hypothetical protein